MYTRPAKILIIDDDVELVTLLVDYLTLEGFEVKPAHDGQTGLNILSREVFDLIILDVMMPGMTGTQVLVKIRETSHTPVLMLTARGDPVDRILGLELGADDYLGKPFAFTELLARVKTLLRRGTAPAQTAVQTTLSCADLTMDLVRHRVTRGGSEITLTGREFRLLEFFLRHKDEVLPRSLIASKVWDINFESGTNAIDVTVKRLRAKCDMPFAVRLIETVRGIGYRMSEPVANWDI